MALAGGNRSGSEKCLWHSWPRCWLAVVGESRYCVHMYRCGTGRNYWVGKEESQLVADDKNLIAEDTARPAGRNQRKAATDETRIFTDKPDMKLSAPSEQSAVPPFRICADCEELQRLYYRSTKKVCEESKP